MCGGQGIVLEIYGGAQGISLPSAMRYIIFYKSSFEDEHKWNSKSKKNVFDEALLNAKPSFLWNVFN